MEYKLIIFGNSIYKEAELYENMVETLLIGTTPRCSVRFNRDYFFDDFEIGVDNGCGSWRLNCAPGIYFKTGSALKQSVLTVFSGDKVYVHYESTDSLLFQIECMPDYDRDIRLYDCVLDLATAGRLSIGNQPGCQIQLGDSSLEGAGVLLESEGSGYLLKTSGNMSLFYKNGFRIKTAQVYLCNGDFFAVAGFSFFVKDGCLYFPPHPQLNTLLPIMQQNIRLNAMAYPKFQKNTRQQYAIPDEQIEVLDPKSKQSQPKRNLLLAIIPMLASLVLMVALRGVMGGGGTFVIYSVATMALGAVMSVWTWFNDGKEYKESEKLRGEKYRAYIETQEERIVGLREKELAILRQKYLSTGEDALLVQEFSPRLFERQKEDEDYLSVYLGAGVIKSGLPVRYKVQEYKDVEDELSEWPGQLADKYEYLTGAPVTVNLKAINALGVVGVRGKLYQILKNTVIDLAVRHFFTDVKFFFVFDKKDKKQFEWMRWLKNAMTGENNGRNFMYDDESEKYTLEFLYSELSRREAVKKEDCEKLEHYVVFVYKSEVLRIHPVARYIRDAARYGFTFIFFEEHQELLEQGCDQIVLIDAASNQGCLVDSKNSVLRQYFSYDHIRTEQAADCAIKLACVYVDDVSLEGSLTKNISLYELFGIINVNDIDLKKHWALSKIYETMAVPLGVKSGDEIVSLDLHEKAHGPHGLVAGTTGSGKSEILQSYILSMSTRFHPYDVGFVIIDFKGGGMVNQFKNLPHLNGAITNIDGREIQRSLLSIRAELRKRQALFAKYEVNHIDAYIKKFKAGETPSPLPHLILIVDEFAELKSDQPEFMKELISAARIGRSLGVHLILATQKPSGVVDDQIWSNSRFKLCLKVQNKEDSAEVLKSPLAAEIKEPGRAYLQVGNNEIFQLFQSAYSGAPAVASSLGQQKSYKISTVELSGKRRVIYEQKSRKQEHSETQLEAIVNYVHDYCEKHHIERLPNICLPPLEKKIPYPEAAMDKDLVHICVPVGIYDDPANQRQEEVWLNLTDSNSFILGSSQYGKTNLLQSVLRGIGELYTPADVNIYIIDFASMILKNFEQMGHVGGVVTSNEDEKLKNLMKLLVGELKFRQEALLKMGLSSFMAYQEAGYREIPQIILMIDNMTAFKELYPQYEDTLLNICREGLSAGISVITANAQTSGIGYKYFANFSRRVALYCNDVAEYGYLFEHCLLRPEALAGRGLMEIEKTIYEFQAFLAFDAQKEIDKTQEIYGFIEQVNKRCGHLCARKIPEIPKVLTQPYIDSQFGDMGRLPYDIYLGINFADTELELLSLTEQGILGIMGRPHSGRSNFVKYVLNTLISRQETEPVDIFIFDSIDKKLGSFTGRPGVRTCTLDAQAVIDTVEQLDERLAARYKMMVDGDMEAFEAEPLQVLVLQNRDSISAISSNKNAMDACKRIVSKYKALKVAVLITDMENSPISFGSPEVLKLLKDNKNLLIFDDLSEQKIIDVPLNLMREYAKPLEAGEAYRAFGSGVIKVKTVLCVEETE